MLLVPGYWLLLAGLVAGSGRGTPDDAAPNAVAALGLGLAVVPFVFMVLAFMTGHPRAPGAVVAAMGLALLVGIPVSAIAGDAITGIVAGVGAGGVVALRIDPLEDRRARIVGVVAAALYTFVLVRAASELALLPAPILPLTAIGVADHLSQWWRERLMVDGDS